MLKRPSGKTDLDVIDAAECYRESEEKIGCAPHGRKDELQLLTKWGHDGERVGGADFDAE